MIEYEVKSAHEKPNRWRFGLNLRSITRQEPVNDALPGLEFSQVTAVFESLQR